VAVNASRPLLSGESLTLALGSWLLVDWVGLASLLGFAAMGLDKLLAVGGRSRVRERTLWLVALLGGFLGVFLGGYVFHHKTSKAGFWGPVAISAVLWALVFAYS